MTDLPPALRTRIKDAAPLHASLLAQCAGLEYSDDLLRTSGATLSDLVEERTILSDRLSDLRRISSRQHEDLKELQHSKLSRFMVRAKSMGSARKLRQRLDASQAEFEEAHRVENEAQSSMRALQSAIEDTRQRVEDLKAKQYRMHDLERSLNTLYVRVFEGEGEALEEAEARQASTTAEKESRLAEISRMRHESVFSYLEQARRALMRAQQKAQQSLMVVNVAWAASDQTRRHYLHIAKDECITAAQSFKRACQGCDQVVDIPQKEISAPGAKIFNNVLNEIISSEELMRKRISHGTISLHYALSHCLLQESSQISRVKTARSIAATAAVNAKNAKTELTAIRRRIMLDVAAEERSVHETGDAAPPTYHSESLPPVY